MLQGDIMKSKVYYQCFSTKLRDYLFDNGINYLIECRHKTTLSPMWIYLYDNGNLLDSHLEKWKTVRKINM